MWFGHAAGKGRKERCGAKKRAKIRVGNCGLVKIRKICRRLVDCGPCACTPASCQAQGIDCLPAENKAQAGGGALVFGGTHTFRGTQVRRNTADEGGGLNVAVGSLTLADGTTVTTNTALVGNGGGGAFTSPGTNLTISANSSVTGNTPTNCAIGGMLSGGCA